MNISTRYFPQAWAFAALVSLVSLNVQAEARYPANVPQPKEGQFVHVPPTMEDLEKTTCTRNSNG